MRLPRPSRRAKLPEVVREVLRLPAGDRVLAFAVDRASGAFVVASRYAVSVASAGGGLLLQRAWAQVDAGGWEPETGTLTVTWADGSRPVSWLLAEQRTLLPETVRERVQASVVLSHRVELGEGRAARVAVRRDFATEELTTQVLLGRRVQRDDPEVRSAVDAALADLRDQVGLPPHGAVW